MMVPTGVRIAVVVFAALLVQLSIVNRIELAGVTGNVLVVVVVAGGYTAGPERGAIVGFAIGLTFDLLLTTPLGQTALVYTAVGYVAGLVATGLIRSSKLAVVLMATLAAPAAMLTWVVIGALFGQTHLVHAPLLSIAVVGAVVAFASVWVVLPAMRWATHDPHGRVRQYS
jgi:rod shape-determining protein MreD